MLEKRARSCSNDFLYSHCCFYVIVFPVCSIAMFLFIESYENKLTMPASVANQ